MHRLASLLNGFTALVNIALWWLLFAAVSCLDRTDKGLLGDHPSFTSSQLHCSTAETAKQCLSCLLAAVWSLASVSILPVVCLEPSGLIQF